MHSNFLHFIWICICCNIHIRMKCGKFECIVPYKLIPATQLSMKIYKFVWKSNIVDFHRNVMILVEILIQFCTKYRIAVLICKLLCNSKLWICMQKYQKVPNSTRAIVSQNRLINLHSFSYSTVYLHEM